MISAIVLAAGTSSRMGEPKPLIVLEGETILARILEAVRHSRVGDVVVVLGHEAERVRREIPMEGATVVTNPAFREGMSTSLRAGVAACRPESEAGLVILADQPFVRAETLDALIEARAASHAKILVPTFRGIRGNPVLVDRSLYPEMATIVGDTGCRAIFGEHPDDLREVPVEDPGVVLDVDTPAELARVRQALARGDSLETLVKPPIHGHPQSKREATARASSARVLTLSQALDAHGEPFVLATVVRATRPTSGKPGNRALIRPDRSVVGWVGGSCTDRAVLAESMKALQDGRSRLLRLTRDLTRTAGEEGVVEYYMECHSGGSMDIYLEPHVPKARLLVVGDSPIADSLAALGRLLDYHVVLAAPKARAEEHPDADEVTDDLDHLAGFVTADTCAVVASMGKYDETALRTLAASGAFYVGLVASRRRAEAVRESLEAAGLAPEAAGRIRSPAGLDLAAETPEEIALSILAEITQVRRVGAAKGAPEAEARPPLTQAAMLDPVCGMEVEADTPLKAIHDGTTYRFCSEMCLERFRASPEAFLG